MDKQTLSFQAEVKQILHLVTHSLYSNKEIFLRELISNASDACDKLRFEAIDKPELYEGKTDLEVRVAFDKEDKTITITDNGIGMSSEEAVAHLGGALLRQPGLSCPAWTGQGEQPDVWSAGHVVHAGDLGCTTKEWRRRNGQVRLVQGFKPRELGVPELIEPLRRQQILQPMLAEVAERNAVGKVARHDRARRLGEEHLAAVAGAHHTGRPMHV